MLLPHGTVFAVVDGENFELYRNSGMEADPKLSPLPTPDLEATNHSAGVRHHDKAGVASVEQLDEFAHVAAVTDWLNHEAMTNRFDKLIVVADPKSLGEMRKHYHKTLKDVLVGELAKTMTGRPADEIVKALRA